MVQQGLSPKLYGAVAVLIAGLVLVIVGETGTGIALIGGAATTLGVGVPTPHARLKEKPPPK